MSLGVADLIAGVAVVPLSVYPALVNRWVYGNAVCGLAGYIEITVWFAQLCTFMWISVDRYLAVRKPLRSVDFFYFIQLPFYKKIYIYILVEFLHLDM